MWAESILKRFKENEKKKPCTEKVLIALNISEKRLMSLDDILEQFGSVTSQAIVSDPEWEVLQMTN